MWLVEFLKRIHHQLPVTSPRLYPLFEEEVRLEIQRAKVVIQITKVRCDVDLLGGRIKDCPDQTTMDRGRQAAQAMA